MSKTHLLAIAVAAALASTLAIAQTTTKAPQERVDANGDGVIDRAEAARFPRLAARFDQIDVNKDGRLDAGERRAQHQRRNDGKRKGAHAGMHGMGKQMDTDGDGRISRAEAQAAAEQVNQRFDRKDTNKDGYLDRADMQARTAQRRAAFFAAADANKDGYLSRDELAARQKAMHDQRPQPPAGKPAPTAEQRAQRMAAMFDRLDANKDGRIDKAEFDAAKPMGGRGAGMHKDP